MPKEDRSFAKYSRCYKNTMIELENNDYPDMETFYEANLVNSDEEYLNILQAGITRPRVFLKREPTFFGEYVNKANRGLVTPQKSNH
ncbi:hypothetical protein TNIN_262901 [Trichonephila inaurata madagascariensis]|uniref:Uncharacterized protein n=1 Tax=Trichonephila inaurata madagascariensis TaxID=2747483 RepID=A0A8X6XJX4_9ARAC|nr:hypothetical protein TNIN_262901 [Trichonephila inaurata madagascariensis]